MGFDPLSVEGFSEFGTALSHYRDGLSQSLAPLDPTGLLRKLLLNQRTSDRDLSLWSHLGFVHVLTATGIHLYVIASLTQNFVNALLMPYPKLCAFRLPIARFMAYSLWLWAWVLGDFRPGMLRPLLSAGAHTATGCWGAKLDRRVSFFCMLLVDVTLAALARAWGFSAWADSSDAGRPIYALAVGGGMLLGRGFNHWGLAYASWILTAVYEGFHTHWISLGTPLVSLLTLGAFTLVIFPLLLSASLFSDLFVTTAFKSLFGMFHHLLFETLEWLLSLPLCFVLTPEALWGALPLALGATFLWATLRAARASWLSRSIVIGGLILLSLGLRYGLTTLEQNRIRWIQLDVGQGDSLWIQDGTLTTAIDTGSARAHSLSNWLKRFSRYGVTRFSAVVLSHSDEDHRGALALWRILIPLERVHSGPDEAPPRTQHLRWESRHFVTPGLKNGNARMRVDWIATPPNTAPQAWILAPGDLSERSESALVKWVLPLIKEQESLNSLNSLHPTTRLRILKVAHHGSRSSTRSSFLEALKFTEAWISSGRHNRFGHPSLPVLERLNTNHIRIKRTDQTGDLIHTLRIKAAIDRRQ